MRKMCACAAVLASLIAGPNAIEAAPPTAGEDAGVGFFMSSQDFGDPCTPDAGNFPVIYDNNTASNVDVSVKLVNTGGSNVFLVGTPFVIPPDGPIRRPRIMRLTLAPGAGLKIQGQASNCGWTAIVRPH